MCREAGKKTDVNQTESKKSIGRKKDRDRYQNRDRWTDRQIKGNADREKHQT